MAPRLELQALLELILGSTNVYFQPPPNAQIQYPCIIYKRERAEMIHADNYPYRTTMRYAVTVIDRDPDSQIPGKVGQLQTARHERFYVADNLNHDVFNIYF